MPLLESLRLRYRWLGETTRLATGQLPTRNADLSRAVYALVSYYVPRSPSGWPIVLENLFELVPPQSVVVVGEARDPWPGRLTLPFPSRRMSLWPGVDALGGTRRLRDRERSVIERRFRREASGLRLVFGVFDAALPLADAVARACGARLWVLALDDHGDPEIHAPILERADRLFAVTAEQAVNVATRYRLSRRPEELLQMTVLPPPRRDPVTGDRQGPVRMVLLGNVYDYHEPALLALDEAVRRTRGAVTLRIVAPPGVTRRPWVPAGWEWREGRHNDVWGDLEQADVGVVILKDDADPRAAMSVAHPVKFRDYLCFGLPILALVPRPSFVARVIETENVGVVPSMTPESLDQAFARLADPVRRVEMGQRARRFAEQHLDLLSSHFLRDLSAFRGPAAPARPSSRAEGAAAPRGRT